jgi:hypothetical protein
MIISIKIQMNIPPQQSSLSEVKPILFKGKSSEKDVQTSLTVENLDKVCPNNGSTILPQTLKYNGTTGDQWFEGQINYRGCGNPPQSQEFYGTFTSGTFLKSGEFKESQPKCSGEVKTILDERSRDDIGHIRQTTLFWNPSQKCPPNSFPDSQIEVEKNS